MRPFAERVIPKVGSVLPHPPTPQSEDPAMRYTWPDGKQSAAVLSFDFDAESGFLFREPEKAKRSLADLEERRFGPRVGVAGATSVSLDTRFPAPVLRPRWRSHHRSHSPGCRGCCRLPAREPRLCRRGPIQLRWKCQRQRANRLESVPCRRWPNCGSARPRDWRRIGTYPSTARRWRWPRWYLTMTCRR